MTSSGAVDEVEFNCIWMDPVQGKYYSGDEYVTLNDVSTTECKAALEGYGQTYKSFDYWLSSRTCYLQNYDRHTYTLSSEEPGVIYYERVCNCKYIGYVYELRLFVMRFTFTP